jgi:hypothetical protein
MQECYSKNFLRLLSTLQNPSRQAAGIVRIILEVCLVLDQMLPRITYCDQSIIKSIVAASNIHVSKADRKVLLLTRQLCLLT